MAPDQGLEPRYSASEADVLPLDESGMSAGYVLRRRAQYTQPITISVPLEREAVNHPSTL